MLRQIKLINFKQHLDRTIEFGAGVNGIRAPNGSGKSNALLAARYALYGAQALPEKLEDVVTYGQPVSKLKVELDLTHAGVDYHVTRSKSSAEVTFGSERVTGQGEVTKHFEKLFGASRDLAAKLMFAKQKEVGGALKDGATATSELIEFLADLSLIDQLVGLVGEHLPAGNTDVQKSLVASLREQAEPGEVIDLAPLQVNLIYASEVHQEAAAAHKAKQSELDNLDLDAAREILATEKLVLGAIAGAEVQREQAEALLSRDPLLPVAAGAVEALQQRVAEQKDLAAAEKLHAELEAADVQMMWDKSRRELDLEVVQEDEKLGTLVENVRVVRAALDVGNKERRETVAAYNVERAKLEGKLIKDTTCALCQKDLKDVPEVAHINSQFSTALVALDALHAQALIEIDEELSTLNEELFEDEKMLAQAKEYRADLEAVVRRADQINLLYARADKYITVNDSIVPGFWSWVGPTAAPQNFSDELAALQAQQRAYEKRITQDEEHRKHLDAQQEKLLQQKAKLAGLLLVDARETLELEIALKPQVQLLAQAVSQRQDELRAVESDLRFQQNVATMQAKNQRKSRELLTAAEVTLAEMEANNVLVKKLRAARPVIADKLWAMVLGAASTYYSTMRGQAGVFTRAGGAFQINGRPCSGMSGAEEDLLGLAIRLALTKMFLPNVDFLVLDEVAAACDDAREEALLALMATVGFPQVIMVSHSPAIDSVADNIITIE